MSQENKPEDIDYPFPIAADDVPPAPQPVAAPQPAYTYQSPPASIAALEVAKPMPPVRTGSNTTAVEVTVGIITFLVILAIIVSMLYLVWWK